MKGLVAASDVAAPLPAGGHGLIAAIEKAGLRGRGGAGFPTATKWRAVAERSRGNAAILVNGAEGEPHSKKDRLLMTARPHLVLDGAFLAARVLRARRIVLYIGEGHEQARTTMLHALAQRKERDRELVTVAAAPARYVAGAEAAAIHFVNEGVATPTTTPPYPFERGVGGAPTLVQNVETLAHVAQIARGEFANSALITLSGDVARQGVVEIALGTTIGDAVTWAGGVKEKPRAVLVGGYFGTWVEPDAAWRLPLDHRTRLGCGVVGFMAESRCPVCDVAAIMRYLAAESSAQCGPCFFGLRALADACTRIAQTGSNTTDLARLQRWATEVRGRGACKHPDGAATFLASALRVFAGEFAHHRTHDLRRSA
jgi:NADH:ubiquinone oxidoreductase subunit F (NADH-binding)